MRKKFARNWVNVRLIGAHIWLTWKAMPARKKGNSRVANGEGEGLWEGVDCNSGVGRKRSRNSIGLLRG